jgi:hypothetical protein
MPQATATYPGITSAHVIAFSGTEGLDATPGRFTLTLSQAATPSPYGTLAFTDGTRTITIPYCRVADSRWAGVGKFQITIEDLRWRWRTGAVYGRYNVPREDYAGVRFEKTPRELAEILWATMEESELDVTLLPNDPRPEVSWYASNPADELIALLASLGCVLAPQLNGSWKVYPVGYGAVYTPPVGFTVATDVATDFATYPDAVSVITGPIQYEAVFALEAVGEETDGRIVPIDLLSYKPAWGWEQEDNDFAGLEDQTYTRNGRTLNLQDLAKSCVRRWYQIASMPAGTGADSLNPPGYPTSLPPVESLYQLLPLVPVINETVTSMGDPDYGKRMGAEVWGKFTKDEQSGLQSRPGTKVPSSFSIDAERGIVKFSQPVVSLPSDFSAINPAELFLRCVVEVQQPEINVAAGYERKATTGLSNGTGSEILFRDDLELQWKPVWKNDGTLDPLEDGAEYPNNRVEVDAEADYYLAAKLAGYVNQTGGTMNLTGIHAPNLNGLQTSVTWSFGAKQTPSTTIGVNTRANPYTPKYDDVQKQKLTRSQELKKQRRERLKARGLFRGQP